MLLAYLDEVAEPGAFVSKSHRHYNGSPAFGYAGLVVPDSEVRAVSQTFTEKKRSLFAHHIPEGSTAGLWERKGSDIFTPVAWDRYRRPIEGFRELVRFLYSAVGACSSTVRRSPWAPPRSVGGRTRGTRSKDDLNSRGNASFRPSTDSARSRRASGRT